MQINEITQRVIGATIEVHRQVGPGLLEAAYAPCVCYELTRMGLFFQQQVSMPIRYKGLEIPRAYRADLIVEGLVVVEFKSVDIIHRVHIAQLMTYLRMSGLTIGLLINFNVPILVHGIKRVINDLPPDQYVQARSPDPEPHA